MSDSTERDALEAVLDMCERLGVSPMNQYEGCWTKQLNEQWWIAVNGHEKPMPAQSLQHTTPSDVPPFTVYVEYNGWPAGLLDPYGGILAAGEGANERTFIAACDEVKGGSR